MREKSATEAIIVASALAAKLEEDNKTLSEYLYDFPEKNPDYINVVDDKMF